jgi:hypothetical protein
MQSPSALVLRRRAALVVLVLVIALFGVSSNSESQVTIAAISAAYAGTARSAFTGAAMIVTPEVKPAFTIAADPSTVTIAPGHSASTKITTTVTNGYDQSLELSALKIPAGVTVTLTPSTIPAPGAGTSKAKITIAKTVAAGTYTMHIRATDGTTSKNAAVTLIVSPSGPGATFRGCWYQQSGHRYRESSSRSRTRVPIPLMRFCITAQPAIPTTGPISLDLGLH